MGDNGSTCGDYCKLAGRDNGPVIRRIVTFVASHLTFDAIWFAIAFGLPEPTGRS